MNRTLIIWLIALIFTLLLAAFQRMTGPTYPVSGTVEFNNEIAEYEELFETTIQRKDSIEELAEKGTAYNFDPELAEYSQKREFTESIFIENWTLPMGAFGEQNGSV